MGLLAWFFPPCGVCVCVAPLFLRGSVFRCFWSPVFRWFWSRTPPSCMIRHEVPGLVDGVPDEDDQSSER